MVFTLIGCSPTPNEKRLDAYVETLEDTDRDHIWYYKNDFSRQEVLGICHDIYMDITKEQGLRSDNISNNQERYLDEDVQEKYYKSNKECWNAYRADKLLNNFIEDKSLDDQEISSIQQELHDTHDTEDKIMAKEKPLEP